MRSFVVLATFLGVVVVLAALVTFVTSLFASPLDQCGVAFPCPQGQPGQTPALSTDQYLDLSHGAPAGARYGALVTWEGGRAILTLSTDFATAKADAQVWIAANHPGATIHMLPSEAMVPSEENVSRHGPPTK